MDGWDSRGSKSNHEKHVNMVQLSKRVNAREYDKNLKLRPLSFLSNFKFLFHGLGGFFHMIFIALRTVPVDCIVMISKQLVPILPYLQDRHSTVRIVKTGSCSSPFFLSWK
jgi:hypothetical protein